MERQNRAAKVLVADGNEALRELLTELLVIDGYEVMAARDGGEALHALCEGSFDLALIDVVMPGCDGFDVCRAFKSVAGSGTTPIILVTGMDSRDDRIKAVECGADDFLNKPVNREELRSRVRSLVRLKRFTDELKQVEAVLGTLAQTIEAKDTAAGHCERLSQLSMDLAKRLGLAESECQALKRGGLMHDIGKIVVPEHILLKHGPLTSDERKIVEQHTVTGERICAPLDSFQMVLPIIRHHHERYDGSGYPDGLAGENIPLTARVLHVADVYEALTTERPYRKAMSSKEAIAVMRAEVKRGWMEGHLLSEFESCVNARPEIPQPLRVSRPA